MIKTECGNCDECQRQELDDIEYWRQQKGKDTSSTKPERLAVL